jgi:hypothetical protein
MAEQYPEPGSWTTVKSQEIVIGDFVWAENEWHFVTATGRDQNRWESIVHIGALALRFKVHADVLIKNRER